MVACCCCLHCSPEGSSYGTTALWAMRGLVRVHPIDIEAVLKWTSAHRREEFIVREAKLEFTRFSDKPALAFELKQIAKLGKHRNKYHSRYGCALSDVDELLQVMVERRPVRLSEALAKAATSDCVTIRVAVSGAKAALGDPNALAYVQIMAAPSARKGDEFK